MALHFSRVAPATEELEIWSASELGYSFVISNESRTGPRTSRAARLCCFLAPHQFQQDGHQSRRIKVCDLPNADNFQLHLFLALAEKERELISVRTKAALRAAKERGQKLGSPTTPAILKARSSAFAASLRDIVEPLAHLPSRVIAAALNAQGVHTATGGIWSSVTVLRLIDRLRLGPRDAEEVAA